MIPTSNHNCGSDNYFWIALYIFWFLHQTTTPLSPAFRLNSCISFDSYIKPQLTILRGRQDRVVYLLIPTSNHNCQSFGRMLCRLYIFWFLHQTTTVPCLNRSGVGCISFDSYIKPQLIGSSIWYCYVVYLLIPTSNHNWVQGIRRHTPLYIFWFLHQTTTTPTFIFAKNSCISFDSYIKPQPITFKYQRTSTL